ncbi:ATP-dependent DNA helicase PcrA protein [Halorhabdus tiamatea SARL4B]|uniref:DNA 3'-5' helicase n=1 Tax=Halorhabdus tiamatea SARL4B TaxID=1033806 RepID=S6D9B2_9EURY|nr:UvrD-helicase domain-containing protein [Halorhabdus tiamatea]ERJ05691.1 ATP-dependent DNA helicase PcrA protein [Halorhabdus tiamatea SARL4B]CCQ34906.1 UvrD/REP helicase [Halorhabdus tiamatea SARL4B]
MIEIAIGGIISISLGWGAFSTYQAIRKDSESNSPSDTDVKSPTDADEATDLVDSREDADPVPNEISQFLQTSHDRLDVARQRRDEGKKEEAYVEIERAEKALYDARREYDKLIESSGDNPSTNESSIKSISDKLREIADRIYDERLNLPPRNLDASISNEVPTDSEENLKAGSTQQTGGHALDITQSIDKTESLLKHGHSDADPVDIQQFLLKLENHRDELTAQMGELPGDSPEYEAAESLCDKIEQEYTAEVGSITKRASAAIEPVRTATETYVRSHGEPSADRFDALKSRHSEIKSQYSWIRHVNCSLISTSEVVKGVQAVEEQLDQLEKVFDTGSRIRAAFRTRRENVLSKKLRETWLRQREDLLADALTLIVNGENQLFETILTEQFGSRNQVIDNVLNGWNGPSVGVLDSESTIVCPACGTVSSNVPRYVSHRTTSDICRSKIIIPEYCENRSGNTAEAVLAVEPDDLRHSLEEIWTSTQDVIDEVRSEAQQRGLDAICETTDQVERELQIISSLFESQLDYHELRNHLDTDEAARLFSSLRDDRTAIESVSFLPIENPSMKKSKKCELLVEELRGQLLCLSLITEVVESSLSHEVTIEDTEAAINSVERLSSQTKPSMIRSEYRAVLKAIYGVLTQNRLAMVESAVSEFADATDTVLPSPNQDSNNRAEYNRYLPTHTHAEYQADLNSVEGELQEIGDPIDKDLFLAERTDSGIGSPTLQKRFERLRESISWYRQLLDSRQQYNRAFVENQSVACDTLFSEIGSNNFVLDEDQRRAVIRNDTYNQVIAAAGTGKTLTLTTRVQYLVQELGVDPNRILLLTFGKDAADEMKERLGEHFDITNVAVSTVHGYGYEILEETKETMPAVFDGTDFDNFVDDALTGNLDPVPDDFVTHFERYLTVRNDDEAVESEFAEKEAYYEAKRKQRYKTLDNETVKSVAERRIANFLFRHQIKYRYEDRASWVESDEHHEVYRPDFYLPEYNIYIEHWGVDERGEVAPWFSQTSAEYRESARWKRQQFTQNDEQTLIETHEFEHTQDRLEVILRARLESHGVLLDRLSYTELVEATFDRYEQKRIKQELKQFIDLAKTFRLEAADIRTSIDHLSSRRHAFGEAGVALLERYEDHLDATGQIDYTDMVNGGLNALDTDLIEDDHRFDHVLVDEFQDLADNQLALIDRMTGPDSARLFCVGDDWQSIFSFRGADVNRFVEFEETFGDVTRTRLKENYRCPETVVTAGNDLIEINDQQIDKRVNSNSGVDTTPLLHELDGSDYIGYEYQLRDYVRELVESYLEKGASPEDIMILCRYEAGSYLDIIREGLRSLDNHGYIPNKVSENISINTIHKAKGREARHVILVHAVEGDLGFPAVDHSTNLLAPVQPMSVDSLAEERRLFYVSMTRSSGTLDIITRSGKESRFITEIRPHLESAWNGNSIAEMRGEETRTSITAKARKLKANSHPTMRQSGVLEDPTGAVRFITWADGGQKLLDQMQYYEFQGIYASNYEGNPQLEIKSDTIIQQIEPPDVPTSDIEPQTLD